MLAATARDWDLLIVDRMLPGLDGLSMAGLNAGGDDAVLETFAALLRIAQIEATAGRERFATVDLTEVLETVAEIYLPMAEEKQQSLERGIRPGLAVQGDRELLIQLFANLLGNAIRHAPEEAQIAIRTEATSGSIDVVVTDDGQGIPEAMRSRVFGRFFRLEASRTTPGSGLGLSLAAAIATLHRTEIELSDNRPGLQARVRLPRTAERVEAT